MSIKQIDAPTIVIQVRGGNIVKLVGNCVMDAIIVDWDNIKSDDTTIPVHDHVFIDQDFVHTADRATVNRHNLKFLEER